MLKKLNDNLFELLIIILIYCPPIFSLRIIPIPLDIRYNLVTVMIKILSTITVLLIFIKTVIYLGYLFNYDIIDYL